MKTISLKAAAIFNMSFGQVFVAGKLDGPDELVRASRWKLIINGKEVAELEAIGEQLPQKNVPHQRVISYKGTIDTKAFDLATDEVLLLKME